LLKDGLITTATLEKIVDNYVGSSNNPGLFLSLRTDGNPWLYDIWRIYLVQADISNKEYANSLTYSIQSIEGVDMLIIKRGGQVVFSIEASEVGIIDGKSLYRNWLTHMGDPMEWKGVKWHNPLYLNVALAYSNPDIQNLGDVVLFLNHISGSNYYTEITKNKDNYFSNEEIFSQ
jgi:hypothetical protein